MARLDGVGADAPVGPAAGGGVASVSPYRFDLLPPLAIAAVAKVRTRAAAKYGEWTWREMSPAEQINRTLQHIFAYQAGDDTELDGDPLEHLRHAATRLLFAVDSLEAARQTQNTITIIPYAQMIPDEVLTAVKNAADLEARQ